MHPDHPFSVIWNLPAISILDWSRSLLYTCLPRFQTFESGFRLALKRLCWNHLEGKTRQAAPINVVGCIIDASHWWQNGSHDCVPPAGEVEACGDAELADEVIMDKRKMDRRDFLVAGALAAGALAGGARAQAKAPSGTKTPAQPKSPASTKDILNYNPNMEYRRLGKTGLMVSAVSLGGHWKRIEIEIGKDKIPARYSDSDFSYPKIPGFMESRDRVLAHCIDVGINYIDAMAAPEVVAYGQLLKGRRDKFYFGYAWWQKETRQAQYRTADKLLQALDENLKESGLDYVDIWRLALPMDGVPDLGELQRVEESTIEALARAKQQGKARHTGVSSHNRVWLKSLIDAYPKEIEVVLFPYTAGSKEHPTDSLFDAIKANDVGVFAIKPFADNSLFWGNSFPDGPHAAGDDRRARLALRYILSNSAITAPIPGLINIHQVDNAVQAIRERRQLDRNEKAELDQATRRMWAHLNPGHEWLRDWEYV
jgi:aryl-alcohol dehydrogenase-like predicted oxidoreductase